MRPLCTLLLALLPACSDSPAGPDAKTIAEQVRQLQTSAAELLARPEHQAAEVKIQHLLVGVAGGVERATRSPAEAEALAAGLLARARAGEDFDLLVKNHTDEQHPGIYVLTTGAADPPRVYARKGFVAGLGDAAWRLQVGELGVVPYDPDSGKACHSKLGYHLVLRLE